MQQLRTLLALSLALGGCGYESYYPSFQRNLLPDTGLVALPCPSGQGAWLLLGITNGRDAPVALSLMGSDCSERSIGAPINAGTRVEYETDSQAIWVVRDATSDALLEVYELSSFGTSSVELTVQ